MSGEPVAEAGSGPPEPVKSIEEDPKPAEPTNQVTDEQWRAMMDVVMGIYDYREADGHDPSRLFHRSVNRRYVPDYYDVIKEPMALSLLKQKINKKTYKNFSEFVRDCALIPHNAQTYNRPKSQAYEDALVIRGVFAAELKKLVDQGIISSEVAEFPNLGEIPEADPLPAEEEEEEEDEEEDEEQDDSDEEDGRRKKGKGRRSGITAAKRRDSKAKDDSQKATDPELRKKRGRPPRVDTPMEARIKAVLKGIRKLKDSDGLKVRHFERLPDKSVYPDYFQEIKEPMAIDLIKRKSKRKKYNSVDHFMKDVDIMFNNAKSYNQADSQLYKDAIALQTEAHRLAEIEKKKPDSEYLMEDGRFPLPNGILHNGELWKVGDWVHIQNPNDATKPIVAQIYRTWQDVDGQQWVNACWYYRPEQTVHQYEKHFYPNEVVKTGQYRDHKIEEIVDRCFVMFFTRYNRGRPRGLSPDKEVYVCEARYNEEKHKLNKIKTWASCLPDEVREKDYEMDLFDAPRKIKKIPSPIKHLLREDAKETDDVPKPTWGAENAPPIVGAVHRRPREENESPPPEPTPSPPPIPPPQSMGPARQLSMSRPPTRQSMDSQGDISMGGTPSHAPLAMHSPIPQTQLPAARLQPSYRQPTAPVYPANYPSHQNPYAAPQLQPNAYQNQPPPLGNMYSAPPQNTHLAYQQNIRGQPPPAAAVPAAVPANAYNPNAPRPVEVYHLNDAANSAIPADVREEFHTDDQGRVLFFTTPPLDPVAPASQQKLAHSAKFIAARKERMKRIAEKKRKEILERQETEERVKKARTAAIERSKHDMEGLERDTLIALTLHIQKGTDDFYKMHFGDRAEEVQAAEAEDFNQRREAYWKKKREDEERVEKNTSKPEPMRWDGRTADGVYLDDIDTRF